jgi:hypothetical protein
LKRPVFVECQRSEIRGFSSTGSTYGAALVSKRMFRFFKSCTSGRRARRFSNESMPARVGEMDDSSTTGSVGAADVSKAVGADMLVLDQNFESQS